MCNKLQKGESVKVLVGRAAGLIGTIVAVKDKQSLPFLVRLGNGRGAVGYTAKEIRRI